MITVKDFNEICINEKQTTSVYLIDSYDIKMG